MGTGFGIRLSPHPAHQQDSFLLKPFCREDDSKEQFVNFSSLSFFPLSKTARSGKFCNEGYEMAENTRLASHANEDDQKGEALLVRLIDWV